MSFSLPNGLVASNKKGVTGIDYGTITVTEESYAPILVHHSLGVSPEWAALIPDTPRIGHAGSGVTCAAMNINGATFRSDLLESMADCDLGGSYVSFYMYRQDPDAPFPPGKYYWFAVE